MPVPLAMERQFLLDRSIEMTDVAAPQFMGHGEEELRRRAERVPTVPLGIPHVAPPAEQAVDRLVKQLAAGDAQERALAAIQLAKHREPEGVFALLRRLGDRDSDVRICALWALGNAGNPLILPPLIEFDKVEKDPLARAQLAATLHSLVARLPAGAPKTPEAMTERIAEATRALAAEPTAEHFLARGRLQLRAAFLLQAVGDFTRATRNGAMLPEALFCRSQAFLLMGKPLFAMDDLIACPPTYAYPPVFFLHRMALQTLARQIVAAAKEKGLKEYADLFEGRLKRISGEEETRK